MKEESFSRKNLDVIKNLEESISHYVKINNEISMKNEKLNKENETLANQVNKYLEERKEKEQFKEIIISQHNFNS